MVRFSSLAAAAALVSCLGCSSSADEDTDSAATGPRELGPCERLIACLEVRDDAITQALARYGENGTCWETFPETACWQDCRAALNNFSMAPNPPDACRECIESSDCAYLGGAEECIDGQCRLRGDAMTSGATDPSGGAEDTDPSGETTPMGEPSPPVAGTYYVAFALTIGQSTPLQFIGEASLDGDMMTLALQPLSLDPGSATEPLEPIGSPVTFEDIALGDDGSFSLTAPLELPAGANPITGTDVVMNAEIEAVFDGTTICGSIAGMVTSPTEVDLAGSTLHATQIGGPDVRPLLTDVLCD